METKVYIISSYFVLNKKIDSISNDEFITQAELEGTVYSLEGFVNEYNQINTTINPKLTYIRII